MLIPWLIINSHWLFLFFYITKQLRVSLSPPNFISIHAFLFSVKMIWYNLMLNQSPAWILQGSTHVKLRSLWVMEIGFRYWILHLRSFQILTHHRVILLIILPSPSSILILFNLISRIVHTSLWLLWVMLKENILFFLSSILLSFRLVRFYLIWVPLNLRLGLLPLLRPSSERIIIIFVLKLICFKSKHFFHFILLSERSIVFIKFIHCLLIQEL